MTENNPQITIRQAKIYDVPAISRIESRTSNTPWSADAITHDILSNDKAYIVVAVCGDETVGYADMWVVAGEAQLNNIAIDEAWRGNHFGEALMSHMIERAIELNCDVMGLEVRRSNETAISMYHKAGFQDIAVRRGYYRDNREDAILMNKDLNAIEADYETR